MTLTKIERKTCCKLRDLLIIIQASKSSNFVSSIYRIVRVKVYQAFLLSGGQSGRIASGDELLLMEFSKAEGVEDVPIETLEPPASL